MNARGPFLFFNVYILLMTMSTAPIVGLQISSLSTWVYFYTTMFMNMQQPVLLDTFRNTPTPP